jgi:predicted metal-binding membrane protein
MTRDTTRTPLANPLERGSTRAMAAPLSPRALFAVLMIVFVPSVAATLACTASMSAMGGMPMPGGWTMSMLWMPMPGGSWPVAAASFLGMWMVMMVAMMLPSLAPMLWRYQRLVVAGSASRVGWLTVAVSAGYFFVWTWFGVAALALGVAVSAAAMQWPGISRAVPLAAGVVVLLAGALQFSAWKARGLARCRMPSGRGCTLPANFGAAWRHGLRIGLDCSGCCAGLMMILLVIGVMDLGAMALITVAISIERLVPDAVRAARAIGAVVVAAALFMIARAAGF